MQVLSYIRVSSKGQLDGDGPERQRTVIQQFAKTHQLVIVEEFFEKAVSGTVEGLDRPAFAELLEKFPTFDPPIEAVLVERMDRLARDLIVSEMWLGECRKRNIKVFAADRGQLTDIASNDGDPTHKLIRQVIAAVAEFEKSVLVKRLRLARERKRKKVGYCEGERPYGFFDGEPEILRLMFALSEQIPRPSYRDIARELNRGGLLKRNKKAWSGAAVHDILKNDRNRISRYSAP